jgi:hypothetical protein
MKSIKEQLEDACNDYFIDDLTQAKNMEFRHGDRYNEPDFKPNSENSFYQMVVNDLIKMIQKKIFISKWGAFAEGDEMQIINPFLNVGTGQEYHVKAKLIIKDDDWFLEYNNKIYSFEDVSVSY